MVTQHLKINCSNVNIHLVGFLPGTQKLNFALNRSSLGTPHFTTIKTASAYIKIDHSTFLRKCIFLSTYYTVAIL